MRKHFTLMFALLCTAVTVCAQKVTDLSQLSNDKKYVLVSKRATLTYSDQVPDNLCSLNGNKVYSIPANINDPWQQFRIEKIEDKYYLYSVGAGKYVSSTGAYEATAATELKITAKENTEYPWMLGLGENWMNSQNAGQTPEGIQINTWDTADDGNCYYIEEATENLPTATDVESVKNPFLTELAQWESGIGEGLLYLNSEKIAARKKQIEDATLSSETWEAFHALVNTLNESDITIGMVTNLPNGLYRLNSVNYEGYRISAAAEHTTVGLQNNDAARTIWYVTHNEDGTCTFKNYLTGEYMQTVKQSVRVAMNSTPVNFTIYPNDGNNGKGTAAFGVGGQYQKLHVDGSKNIVGWESAKASSFALTTVSDVDLEAAVAAEKTLATTEYQALFTEENINKKAGLVELLSVEAPTTTVPENVTLNDYMDGIDATIYPQIANNVYRIVTSADNGRGVKAFGVVNGTVMGVDYEGVDDVDFASSALWQLRPYRSGFKLVNLNHEANNPETCALSNVEQGDDKAATLKTFADAATYNISINENKTIKFTGAGTTIHMESATYGGTGDDKNNGTKPFVLNSWGFDSNSNFELVKVEQVDVTLTDAAGEAWASAYLPFGVKNEATGVTLLTGTEVGSDYVAIEETNNVAAKNGFVIKAAAGTAKATLKIDNTATATSEIGGSTVATTVDDTNIANIYVLGEGVENSKVGFYNLAAAGTVAANKAFIETAAGVKGFVLSDGTATAIENVETNTNGNAAIYDLSGRRVNKAVKGIFIINGKKVIR